MTLLISCPACQHRVSTHAAACTSCGHPIALAQAEGRQGLARVAGQVALGYISTTTLASLVLGVAGSVCIAAVLITLILSQR